MRLLDRLAAKRAWMQRQRRGIETFTTPVLGWMELATAGMLHPGQYALFSRAVRELPTDDPVIEIGSWAGLSANVITHLLERYAKPNRLFTTDPWDFERSVEEAERIPESDVSFDSLRMHVREQFERNLRFWSGDRLPYAFELFSDDFFDAWDRREARTDVFDREATLGGPVSFVYIDGDHREDQARRDFENADRFLVRGGLILIDDSDRFGAWPHLYQLVREACHHWGYEPVAENPHRLLRKLP